MFKFSTWYVKQHVYRYLLLGMGLLVAGCGFKTVVGGSAPAVSGGGCGIAVSWAMGYKTLKELKNAYQLDIAVQGTFVKKRSIDAHPISADIGSADPTTDSELKVSKVLLDPKHLAGGASSSLLVHQTGGWKGNQFCEVSDDSLFREGEEVIVFLQQIRAGQYVVIGGPSGRFEVRNGQVQTVNDEGVKLEPGLSVERFYEQLRAA